MKWLIKKLLIAYYKKTRFLTWSFPVDGHTEIHVISEETYKNRHRYGVEDKDA